MRLHRNDVSEPFVFLNSSFFPLPLSLSLTPCRFNLFRLSMYPFTLFSKTAYDAQTQYFVILMKMRAIERQTARESKGRANK